MTTMMKPRPPEPAVVMEILAGGEPSYERVELHELTKGEVPRLNTLKPSLCLVRFGEDRVTRRVIEQLDEMARVLLIGALAKSLKGLLTQVHTIGRKQHEIQWYSYEAGKPIREITLDDLRTISLKWDELYKIRRARSGEGIFPPVLIGFQPGDTLPSVDVVWNDFEQSLLNSGEVSGHSPSAAGAGDPIAPTNSMAATAAMRDELLARNWPTSEEVGRANGSRSANKGQWAKDKRAAGELLGVWSASERTYRHPTFQFNPADGALRPFVKTLLDALANRIDFSPLHDKGGWRRAFWLYGETMALAGSDGVPRIPAEVFPNDPVAVVQAARMEAEADRHVLW